MREGKDDHSGFNSVPSIHVLTKSSLGKKGSLAHSSRLQFIMVGKSGRELKYQIYTWEQREANVPTMSPAYCFQLFPILHSSAFSS